MSSGESEAANKYLENTVRRDETVMQTPVGAGADHSAWLAAALKAPRTRPLGVPSNVIVNGGLVATPAVDVALALAGMAQGLVSMQRAKRFSSDKQFRTLFRAQLHHCLQSFS